MRSFRLRKSLWFLVAALAIAAVTLTVARTRISGYRRFTSKPLPDGSRYTFLYPDYLKDVVEGPGGSPEVIAGASVYNRGGEHPEDVNRTPWGALWRKAGFSKAESVTLVVLPSASTTNGGVRTSEEWVRRHNEYLAPSHAKYKLQLYYSCAKDAAQFRQHSRIISDSLRLIPPSPSSRSPRA